MVDCCRRILSQISSVTKWGFFPKLVIYYQICIYIYLYILIYIAYMIRENTYQRHVIAMFIFIRIKPCENLYMKCVMYFINILKLCRHISRNIIHLTQLYIHTNNILLGYIWMNAHTNKMKAFPQLMV